MPVLYFERAKNTISAIFEGLIGIVSFSSLMLAQFTGYIMWEFLESWVKVYSSREDFLLVMSGINSGFGRRQKWCDMKSTLPVRAGL